MTFNSFISNSPWTLFFLTLLLLSYLIIASSSSIFLTWMGIEINLYAFIPLLAIESSPITSNNPAIIYLVTQTIGSSIFLLWILLPEGPIFLLLISLMLNGGAAPLHVWLPTTTRFCSWANLLALLTIQNLPSLLTLIMCQTYIQITSNYNSLMLFFIACSVLYGSVLGIIQTEIRLILTYSSIAQIGWLIWAAITSNYLFFSYFTSYLLIISALCMAINSMSPSTHYQDQQTLIIMSNQINVITSLLLLTIGGMPPLLLFLPNFFLIANLSISPFSNFLIIPLILASAAINLFFYIKLFSPWSTSLSSNSNYHNSPSNQLSPLLYCLVVSPLLIPSTIIFIDLLP